jgi:hypothetical protein
MLDLRSSPFKYIFVSVGEGKDMIDGERLLEAEAGGSISRSFGIEGMGGQLVWCGPLSGAVDERDCRRRAAFVIHDPQLGSEFTKRCNARSALDQKRKGQSYRSSGHGYCEHEVKVNHCSPNPHIKLREAPNTLQRTDQFWIREGRGLLL